MIDLSLAVPLVLSTLVIDQLGTKSPKAPFLHLLSALDNITPFQRCGYYSQIG
ncbi:MAG: hypothetical protein H7A36_01035 [Chlamydiales bacterium]|nr:hypothetical protein [Chlamydiales bacterium]